MTPATSPLPSNWALVLKQIQTTLTQTIHLAETREAALEASIDERPPTAPSLLPPNLLATRLDGLDKQVKKMETPLANLDQTLQGEEEYVRRHLAMVADLSHRLAEWTAGAVG
jgi:hypothetical protein